MARNGLWMLLLSAVLLGAAACAAEKNGSVVQPDAQAREERAERATNNARTQELVSTKRERPPLELDLGRDVTMRLVWIPPGAFVMGSPDNEVARAHDEGPQHPVRIAQGFYMAIHEVTQEQYEAVTGANPADFKGPKNPVEQVSWNDAVEYCKRLSAQTGMAVRLPTEAEWEYACRAGTTTRYSFGDQDRDVADAAWYAGNSGGTTQPVGLKKPNAFGLYDMHGNVWEWCADWYEPEYYSKSPVADPQGPATGIYRVLRGGSFRNEPARCRSARRFMVAPQGHNNPMGFRVVIDASSE